MSEFRARKRRQWAVTIPVILIMVFFVWVGDERGKTFAGVSGETLGVVFLVYVLGVVAFSFWNWRCPACGRYLGRGVSPHFCPKCGAQLR